MRAVKLAFAGFLFAAVAYAAPGTFYFVNSYPSVYENTGNLVLNVGRYGGTTGSVTVDFATADGSAIAGTDYTTTSGTLTFADGEISKPITIPILNRSSYNGSRYFYVNLSNPTGGATLGSTQTAVTIYDIDPAPTVTINDISVVEGNSGTTPAVFTVTISGSRTINIQVSWYTSSGSAYSGSDFQYNYGTLTFAPGDTQKTITVLVYGDTIYEPNEYFYVDLYASNAYITKYYGLCTILNDDAPPTITADDISIVEGNSGKTNAVVTLKANQPLYSVYVNYSTVNGSAHAGSDFDFTSGVMSFYGDTQKQIFIPIIGDTEVEPDKAFTIHLTSTCCNTITILRPDITVTILNDDQGVGPVTQNVAKGSTATVLLDLGNPPPSPQTIGVAVSDPCISAPSSVVLSGRSVPIPVTALSAPCSANVTVTLPAAIGGKTFSAGIRTFSPLNIAFDPPSPKVYVGQTINVHVTASPLDTPVTMTLAALGGTADVPASVDVGPSGGSFTVKGLKAGVLSINVTLPGQNGGGTAQLFGEVDDTPTTVTILQISPVSGPTAGGTTVALSGANFAGNCTVAFGGAAATNVVFGSATSMTVTTPAHAAGTVDVTATCGSETFTLANAFTFTAGTPTISAVTPSFGATAGGTTVRIGGRDFAPSCWAFFDGNAARSVNVASATEIIATTPAHPPASVPVSLRCGIAGDASLADAFNYSAADEPAPVITAVTPLSGAPGQPITISGSRFRTSDSVTFDTTAATMLSTTPDTHVVTLPALPLGKVSVNVIDRAGHVSTTGPIFTALEGITPQVTKVSPTSVPAGGELTIDGTGFRAPYSFALGDTPAKTVTMSYTRAVVRVPALAAGTYELRVLNGSGQVAAVGGNVTVTAAGVVVTSVSPLCATSDGGATIAIGGSGFAAGATVTIGGVAATNVTVVDSAHISATSPALAPGWATVVVTNPGGGSGSATSALRVFSPFDPDGCSVAPRPRPIRH